jgi:uncharacterized membrane protein
VNLMSADEENREAVEEGVTVSSRFLLLLFLGFVLVVVGVAVILVASVLDGGGSVSGGAVIFIGPFPIVIGAGPDVTWTVLFSIILAILSIVAFLVINRKIRRLENYLF